jgi:ankyrin repeat protein
MSEQFNSALRLAAQNGHIDVVKLMKTYGATDFKGAMIGSIRNGHIDITEYLKSLCLEDIEYTTHFDNNGREIIKVVYLLKG